jgi:hypothetical protein
MGRSVCASVSPVHMHLTQFETGLIGVSVGAILSGGFLSFQQVIATRAANRSAIGALDVELLHVVMVAATPKVVGFTVMPSDAYVQALPYLSRIGSETLGVVVDAEIAIAAYNSDATFFNAHGAP